MAHIPDFNIQRIARKGLLNITKLSTFAREALHLLQSSELKLENHSWIRLLQEVSKTYLYDAFKPYFISETSVTVLE